MRLIFIYVWNKVGINFVEFFIGSGSKLEINVSKGINKGVSNDI